MARRQIEAGAKGFKFHPSSQAFMPNDRSVYPVYEVIQEAGVPALFHTGQTGAGAGTRGGGGIRLAYSNPMHLDDVAVDFPDMPIILAHPSFPWQEEALSVATHKPQVYIDLSGWSPKYFPPILIQYANTLLKHKMLFGTDFPVLTPERWMSDLEKIAIRDEVKPGIFKDNAAKLLGLTELRSPEPGAAAPMPFRCRAAFGRPTVPPARVHPHTRQAWRNAERANSSAAARGSGAARTSSQSRMYSPRASSQRAPAGDRLARPKSGGAGWA